MKKLTAFLIAIIIIKTVSAQISDGNARLAYQQINDAYENTSYYAGSQMSVALKQKMGKWTPKVMYMYLQCVFKNYTEVTQDGGTRYPIDYKKFCGFKNQTDTFFTLIDKATYPQDKYNDMVSAQKYFSDMMVKYKYQDGRTPENAVAFLNECALKFTSPRIGGESVELLGTVDLTNEYGDKNFAKYVHFRLLDGYLYVTIVSKWKYSFDKKEFTAILNNDVIDLHIGQAANVMNTPLKCYVNHRVYRLHKNNDIPKEDSMLPKKVLIKNTENFQYTYHWQYKNEERVGTHNIAPVNLRYLVLNLFDQSLQFHNEHYEERILEAFNFLLNYYPAQPGNDAPKEETNKPLGF